MNVKISDICHIHKTTPSKIKIEESDNGVTKFIRSLKLVLN